MFESTHNVWKNLLMMILPGKVVELGKDGKDEKGLWVTLYVVLLESFIMKIFTCSTWLNQKCNLRNELILLLID